jgi:anti-sigma regulatory factor (Ser/Thr protein kinase)
MIEQRISVAGHAAQLPVLMRFLQEFWSATAMPPAEAVKFELALEEVFMNVVMHGMPGAGTQVEVSVVFCDGGLTLVVENDGPAFDPLLLPAPDVEANLEDRKFGGLGVFLVRQMMDAVSYQRLAARNQLRMTKRLTAGGESPRVAPGL